MFGFDLPWFEKALNWTHRNVWADKFDERMDLLSKMLALYPFTDIDKLVDEFKLTAGRINQLAQFYGVAKRKRNGAILTSGMAVMCFYVSIGPKRKIRNDRRRYNRQTRNEKFNI